MKTLIGGSKHIQKLREAIGRLASMSADLVITGEPGTGKSVVAELIHAGSPHAQAPFVRLDVASIDEVRLRSLVHSILTNRKFVNPTTSDHGNFHLPDGSTLILDEIESASFPAQTILDDFMTKVRREGGGLRFMVLLNGDVKSLLVEEKLLPSVGKLIRSWETVTVPALRERLEDIPELIEHFVFETAREMGLGSMVIDVNAVGVLVRKEWRGNVRELKSFIERAMLLSENKDTFVLPDVLVDEQSELTQMLEHIEQGVEFAIDRSMQLIEKRILERVLRKFDFNQSRAARFLKITEDTLRYRMKKLGIQNLQNL